MKQLPRTGTFLIPFGYTMTTSGAIVPVKATPCQACNGSGVAHWLSRTAGLYVKCYPCDGTGRTPEVA